MSYEIAPIILFSHDRSRLLNFLSDVFEFEVDTREFLVFNQALTFRLENIEGIEHSDSQLSSSIAFSFNIKSEAEIDSILNKYNFFQYRRGQSYKFEKCDVIDNEYFKTLKIIDIDNRPWCFEFKKAI